MTNVDRKPSDEGSVQLISGGGDSILFNRKIKPGWNLVHNKINHYVQADVAGDEMTFRAVDVSGKVFDEWKLKTKGQPVAMGK